MTDRTLPLLFVNLGGEMLYIIEDRLTNQEIAPEKTKKVLHDIVATMLNERFVEELFKPQRLSNRHALRTLFDNLAHVSIMRLNRTSMNKLYDLMVSVVKYQIYSAPRPQDLLLVTMNHLEALAGKEPTNLITRLISNYHTKFIKTYAAMQSGELQVLRNTILNYLQDDTVRVSVLLKDKTQNHDGRFVISTNGPVAAGCEVPVIIRNISKDGTLQSQNTALTPFKFTPCLDVGSLGLNKPHVTPLGLNIYNAEKTGAADELAVMDYQRETFNPDELLGKTSESSGNKLEKSVGYQELNLLSKLLLSNDTNNDFSEKTNLVLLDLFPSEDAEYNSHSTSQESFQQNAPASPALVVDARNQEKGQELEALYREMCAISKSKLSKTESSEDLLNLLPSSNC